MSRLSSFLRRIFRQYRGILVEVGQNVIDPIIIELRLAIKQKGAQLTDAELRAIARKVIEEYINKRYPHHEWIVDKVLDTIESILRDKLRKKR